MGALAGGVNGGITALLTGENFIEGVFKGAIIGGAVAGISWGMEKLFTSKNDIVLNADGKFEYNGQQFQDKEELLDYINKNIGNVETIKRKLNITDIDLANNSNVPIYKDKYIKIENGLMKQYKRDILGNRTKELISVPGAITIRGESNTSRVLVAPALKGIHINGHSLTKTFLNHEFIHSYHIMIGLTSQKLMERSAWSYNYAYARYHRLDIAPFLKGVNRYGGFNLKFSRYRWSNAGLNNFIKLF